MDPTTPSEPRTSRMVERLSGMQWNRFHTVIVLLFGMGWAMDAFEVTLIGVIWIIVMTAICYIGIELSARLQQMMLGAEFDNLSTAGIACNPSSGPRNCATASARLIATTGDPTSASNAS